MYISKPRNYKKQKWQHQQEQYKWKGSLSTLLMKIRTFDKGKVELTTFTNGTTIGRITLEPGWSWEKCVKPKLYND